MLFDLTGKTAVVTGGSRGIGLMAARGLLDAGARVYVVSRDSAACDQAAAELSDHGEVIPLGWDLSSPEGCASFCAELGSREDLLHILLNNAGAVWGAPLADYPVSGWDKVMNLNLRTPFLLVQGLLALLEAAATPEDPARIVNVGSIDGLRVPRSKTFAYSASKAGLHHLTRALAVELGKKNISVNAVAPGTFESKMMATTLDEQREQLEQVTPLSRIGNPDDIAGVMVYLCSRAGAYVSGAVIPVDGGVSLMNEV